MTSEWPASRSSVQSRCLDNDIGNPGCQKSNIGLLKMDKISLPALEFDSRSNPKDESPKDAPPEVLAGIGEILWKVKTGISFCFVAKALSSLALILRNG